MEEAKKCPKCDGEMESGTFGNIYGSIVPWARGGMFLRWISSSSVSKEVHAYCCKACGYMETYGK